MNEYLIKKIKKNGKELLLGYGTLTKNPQVVTTQELQGYRKLTYVKFDGVWYRTKISSLSHLEVTIASTPTYCYEDLFNLIYDLVYGEK